MDIAFGVAGLLSLALKVTGALHEYTSCARSAQRQKDELLEVIKRLSSVLRSCQGRIPELHRRLIAQDTPLNVAQKKCFAVLKRISTQLDNAGSSPMRRFLESTAWPFQQQEVLDAIKSIQDCIQIFEFCLLVGGLYVFPRLSQAARLK